MEWYAGGKQRPELQAIAWKAFKEFGVPLELDPSPTPPAGDLGVFFRFLPGINVGQYHNYFHTDWGDFPKQCRGLVLKLRHVRTRRSSTK